MIPFAREQIRDASLAGTRTVATCTMILAEDPSASLAGPMRRRTARQVTLRLMQTRHAMPRVSVEEDGHEIETLPVERLAEFMRRIEGD